MPAPPSSSSLGFRHGSVWPSLSEEVADPEGNGGTPPIPRRHGERSAAVITTNRQAI